MVSAGAVSCALPSQVVPVAGSRAAPTPNEPESHQDRQTNPRRAAGLQIGAHERTRTVLRIQTNLSLAIAKRTRRPAADLMARGHERTRAVRRLPTTRASP
jgi:hypothetical protein